MMCEMGGLHGQVTNVLLSIAEYQRLTGQLKPQKNIAELLAMHGFEDIDLSAHSTDELARAADFS
jgi:hypothetical protein